jgi:hypothetical protein
MWFPERAMNRAARAALAACGLYACTYAWPIGAAPGDAGSDGPPSEASTDAPDEDTEGPDGGQDAPADSPPPLDVDADCQGLRQDVDASRVAAKKCFGTVGDCTLTVTTECGCKTWVEMFNGQADYQAKANALKNSGCPLNCTSCTPIGDAAAGFCLASGSSGLACSP